MSLVVVRRISAALFVGLLFAVGGIAVTGGTGWAMPATSAAPSATLTVPGSGRFGGGVSVSADGNTVLVGGRPVAVFSRLGRAWTLQARLVHTGNGEKEAQVALSANGRTALVGSAVGPLVFTRSASGWRRVASLGSLRSAAIDSVAISGDGRLAAVNLGLGAVDLYVLSRGRWVSAGVVTGNDPSFGGPLALSGDGGTLMVGDLGAGAAPGAVYVYGRSLGSWSLRAVLHEPHGVPGDGFGVVAISASGNTALVGAAANWPSRDLAYIFTRSAGRWTMRARFSNGGQQVLWDALSADGKNALIDRDSPEGSGVTAGAYLFSLSDGRWAQRAHLLASDQEGADRDSPVALSRDGSIAVLGASGVERGHGAAYVFEAPWAATSTAAKPTITITPATIQGNPSIDPITAGQTVYVLAQNYQPHERVWMTECATSCVRVSGAPADARGMVAVDIQPQGKTGVHTICGVGAQSKKKACGTFTVTLPG